MSKTVSEQQLAVCKGLQTQLEGLVYRYGELSLQKRVIETELASVEEALNENQTQRDSISKELQEEFGYTGTVNLATGEFTPA